MRGSETDCNREGKKDGNIKFKKKKCYFNSTMYSCSASCLVV